jgi:hypothetical protein
MRERERKKKRKRETEKKMELVNQHFFHFRLRSFFWIKLFTELMKSVSYTKLKEMIILLKRMSSLII